MQVFLRLFFNPVSSQSSIKNPVPSISNDSVKRPTSAKAYLAYPAYPAYPMTRSKDRHRQQASSIKYPVPSLNDSVKRPTSAKSIQYPA